MKKIISLFLITAMCFSVTACSKGTADSETATSDSAAAKYEYTFRDLDDPVYISPAQNFSGGTGTADDPYQIATAEELSLLSEKINSDESAYEYRESYFILTNDISLNDTENYQNWANEAPQYSWDPIGKGALYFTGTFDGNGHTVSGMYININLDDKDAIYDNAGLFGAVQGTVKNLNVDKSYICVSGYTGYIGGVCGELSLDNAQLINCTSSVNIDLYDACCGGVAGSSTGVPKIVECTFSGKITQIKDKSLNKIGGILGSGGAEIKNCENEGSINVDAINAEYIGGIVGRFSEGSISDCKNNGDLLGKTNENNEDVGVSAGGIAGVLYISNIGGSDASTGISVKNCENFGKVSSSYNTAGIAAEVSNDKSENAITISNCKNSGEISGAEKISGIVSLVNCEGAKITIENCENTSDISGNEVGGIIREVLGIKGNLSVKNCINSANIKSEELYSAGIISYILLSKDVDLKINLEKCTNNGKIVTSSYGGGIIGFADSATMQSSTDDTELSIKNCQNNGDIYTSSSNAFIGGISGNLGLEKIKTSLSDCVNTGSLEFEDVAADEETINAESDERFQLTRMCGGIVGRIGSGLVIVADSSSGNDSNINKEDAYIQISNCYSCGEFIIPAEEKYLNSDGTPIYTNVIGGIIGSCTGEKEYSVNVVDCGYCNTERGMGEECFKNVGAKMSESEIKAKIR